MVAQSAAQSMGNARRYTTCDYGQCLRYTRTWLEIASYYGDAATAWEHAAGRHKGDRQPPEGAPVFWTGGSHGYGHIALSLGGGTIRTTDATTPDHVSTQSLSWPEQAWGLHYAGWAENLNTTDIPYLRNQPPRPAKDTTMTDQQTLLKTEAGGAFSGTDWRNISFDDGSVSLPLGPHEFVASLAVTFDGVEAGSIRTRCVQKADGEVYRTHEPKESPRTSGDTYVVDTRVGGGKDGARLFWQARVDGGQGRITHARFRLVRFS